MTDALAAIKTMPGRDVLALAIRVFEDRAAFGVSCAEAYGEAAVGAGLRRNIELDAAMATILTVLMARGALRIEDLPKGKDGAASFTSKLKFETTREIVQLAVGALRGAFAKVTADPVSANTGALTDAA